MPARFRSTITIAAAEQHLRTARPRTALHCRNINGFYLYKLKRGAVWRWRYRDDAGRRRTVTIGRFPAMLPEAAAVRVLDWMHASTDPLREKASKRERAAADEAMRRARTLENFLTGAYAKHQARRKTGADTLARIRANFPEFLARDMASLCAADIRAWQERREAEGRQYATLRRAFTALKTCLRVAVKHGILEGNPLAVVQLEREVDDGRAAAAQARRKAARRLLTDQELAALHEGLRLFDAEARARRRNSRAHGKAHLPDLDAVAYAHWFVPFCLTGLYTGMRPSDLFALTWREVSIDFGRIVHLCEKTRHHREPAEIVMDMAPPLHDTLRAWHRQQGRPDDGFVFPSPITNGRMCAEAHRDPWARVKELAGLPAELDFYAFRHHFISSLVAAGVPMLTVAKLAGQKSATMIEKHYGHLAPASAASAIAAFAESATPKRSRR